MMYVLFESPLSGHTVHCPLLFNLCSPLAYRDEAKHLQIYPLFCSAYKYKIIPDKLSHYSHIIPKERTMTSCFLFLFLFHYERFLLELPNPLAGRYSFWEHFYTGAYNKEDHSFLSSLALICLLLWAILANLEVILPVLFCAVCSFTLLGQLGVRYQYQTRDRSGTEITACTCTCHHFHF